MIKDEGKEQVREGEDKYSILILTSMKRGWWVLISRGDIMCLIENILTLKYLY